MEFLSCQDADRPIKINVTAMAWWGGQWAVYQQLKMMIETSFFLKRNFDILLAHSCFVELVSTPNQDMDYRYLYPFNFGGWDISRLQKTAFSHWLRAGLH